MCYEKDFFGISKHIAFKYCGYGCCYYCKFNSRKDDLK